MILFQFRYGTTQPLLIQLTQTDPVTKVTTVFPLTGVTDLSVHLRPIPTATVIDINQGAGVTITDAANGIISVTPPGTVTVGLYSGWITFTSGGLTQSFPNTNADFNLQVLEAY